MIWRKISEAKPVHTGQYFVKTKDGRKAIFNFTGSDISFMCMRDQYEMWLDEAELSSPKKPETVHGNEAEKEVCECSEWYEDAKGQRRCPECNELRKYHS